MSSKLSVIIVTYNSAEDIIPCLRSVYAEDDKAEVLVLDNASGDHTIPLVESTFPQVRMIPMGGNFGYAKAVNRGLSLVQGRFCLILNPDCWLLPGTISTLTEELSVDAVGAVGPKLVDEQGMISRNGRRNKPTWSILLLNGLGIGELMWDASPLRGFYYPLADMESAGDAALLSGSCMMIKREVVKLVGGMDTGFFLFGEDIDYCLRIFRRGFRLYYQPHAVVVHLRGKSRRGKKVLVTAEGIWSASRLGVKLGGPFLGRFIFLAGMCVLPIRILTALFRSRRDEGLNFGDLGAIFKYTFSKVRRQGFPWVDITQEIYIPLKDSG